MRRIASLVVALIALALATNPAASEEKPEAKQVITIKVGVFLDLSGALADFGLAAKQGVELAFEELNGESETSKQRFEVVYKDTQSRPEEARAVAEQLVKQSKVAAAIGPITSGMSMAAAPQFQNAGVPVITPSATNPKVTEMGDCSFRACYMDKPQAEAIAVYAHTELKKKRAAILYSRDDSYSEALATAFGEAFRGLGGEIALEGTYVTGETNFATLVGTAKKANPDVLFLPCYYNDAALIAKEAAGQSLTVQILGGDGWEAPSLAQAAEKSLEDSVYATCFLPDAGDAATKFSAAYEAKFKTKPNSLAALGYDAARMLAAACAKAVTKDSQGIAKALRDLKGFEGVTGKDVSFDVRRDAVKPVLFGRIKDGKVKLERTLSATEVAKVLADARKPAAKQD